MNRYKKLMAVLLTLLMLAGAALPALAGTVSGTGSFTLEAVNGAWHYVDAGGSLTTDSGTVIRSESGEWVYESAGETDAETFEGMQPTEQQSVIAEDGTAYTIARYKDSNHVAELNSALRSDVELSEQKASRYGIDDEGLISVIIELDGAPLAEVSEGELLGRALTESELGIRTALLDTQDTVLERIRSVASYFELGYSYTIVANGFSATVRYDEIARIAKVAGVKSVNALVSFDAPKVSYNSFYDENTQAMRMLGANNAVNANGAWNDGYKGEGMVVAVIDTGIDTDNANFALAPASPALSAEAVAELVAAGTLNASKVKADLTGANVYLSAKLPFCFDYADKDVNVNHGGKASSHGTHVAGIVAGNPTEANIRDYGLSSMGVAPEAQLVILKTFKNSDGSCTLDMVAAALEDAILLGVDAANLSLGTVNGPVYFEGYTEIFDRAAAAGINVVTSNGNAYSSTFQGQWDYDLGLTSDPDVSTVGMPATFDSTLAVASINNPYYFEHISAAERDALIYDDNVSGYGDQWRSNYRDLAPSYPYKMAALLGGKSYEYVIFTSTSCAETYEGVDVTGKLVFTAVDTEASFDAQAEAAKAAGAAGLLIYNPAQRNTNVEVKLSVWGYPAVGVSLRLIEDYLNTSKPETIYVNPYWNDNSDKGEMSDFSSWGCTEQLTLKPEITAVGGEVTSAYNGNSLARMSGTSMASPMAAAGTALVKQYLKANFDLTDEQLRSITDALLMSTAVPVAYPDSSLYYSPRKQGAGLMNIGAAIASGAYLSVDGGKPKAELGDDPEKTGEYSISFELVNLTDSAKTYDIETMALTEDVETARINPDGSRLYLMTQTPRALEAAVMGMTEVTVPANGRVNVSLTLTLSEADREYMDSYFENGIYVEGFVRLVSRDEGTDLGLPFLGFYGSWLDVPVFEDDFYFDFPDPEVNPDTITHLPNEVIVGDENTETYKYLGASTAWPNNSTMVPSVLGNMRYVERRNAVSPNGDGICDRLAAVYTSMLRDANNLSYVVVDAVTGEEYYRKDFGYCTKTMFMEQYGQAVPMGAFDGEEFDYDFTDANGNPLPNNTMVLARIEATKTYKGESRVQTWEFPITVDLQSPVTYADMTSTELEYEEWSDEEDDYVGTGEFYDARTIQIAYSENQFLDWGIIQTVRKTSQGHTKVYSNKTIPGQTSGKMSYIEYGDEPESSLIYYRYRLSDYAGNEFDVTLTLEDLLNTVSIGFADSADIYLKPGESLDITAYSGFDFFTNYNLSWSSSDEAIAVVTNENSFTGTVTGSAVGDAVITVQNGFLDTASITVHVVPDSVKINATAGEGGTIAPAGESEYTALTTAVYTISPDENFHIADVLVDGSSVGAVESYSFDKLYCDHSIEALFAANEFTVSFVDGLTAEPIGSAYAAYGTGVTPPEAPVHEGYTFVRWIGETESIVADTTVVAFYKEDVPPAIPTYSVFFVDGVTGSVISTQLVAEGSDAVPPEAPEHDHYRFAGWNAQTTGITADSVIVALYERVFVIGDADADGNVNAADAAHILRLIVELVQEAEVDLYAADVDGDGYIGAADAARILRYLVELDTLG